MKKILSFVLAAVLMLSLVACGGGGSNGGADPIVGEWKLNSMAAGGQTMTADQLKGLGFDLSTAFGLTFSEDGKATLKLANFADPTAEPQTMEGTWKNADGAYTLNLSGADQEVKLTDNNSTLSIAESGMEMTFKK